MSLSSSEVFPHLPSWFAPIADFTVGGVWRRAVQETEDCGGPSCAAALPMWQKLAEFATMGPVFIFITIHAFRSVRTKLPSTSSGAPPTALDLLMAVLCMIGYGSQLFFKSRAGTLIFLLNPCHMITLLEIFVLVSRHSRVSQTAFQMLVYLLFNPFLPLLFPATRGLVQPFEREFFFYQHWVIAVIVPLHLLLSNRYKREGLETFCFAQLAYGVLAVWTSVILWPLSELTWANLNQILCAASSDPFAKMGYARYYRWFAYLYLFLFNWLFGRLVLLVGHVLDFVKGLVMPKPKKN